MANTITFNSNVLCTAASDKSTSHLARDLRSFESIISLYLISWNPNTRDDRMSHTPGKLAPVQVSSLVSFMHNRGTVH